MPIAHVCFAVCLDASETSLSFCRLLLLLLSCMLRRIHYMQVQWHNRPAALHLPWAWQEVTAGVTLWLHASAFSPLALQGRGTLLAPLALPLQSPRPWTWLLATIIDELPGQLWTSPLTWSSIWVWTRIYQEVLQTFRFMVCKNLVHSMYSLFHSI